MSGLGPDLLFVPADRPDRYAKAAERASAVIIDLEDAVAPADRPAARRALVESSLDPETTIVRVTAVGTDTHREDVEALRSTHYRHVMLPKAQDPAKLCIPDAAGEPYAVTALVETAVGVAAAEAIAAVECVEALFWGAEDLTASTGGTGSRRGDGSYRDLARYARMRTLVAAKAAGKVAIDSVYLDLPDLAGLREEALDAVAVGFDAKAVLHPSQAEVIREAYRPSPDRVAWAHEVLAAAEQEQGAFRFRGGMVDEVVLKQARQVLARAR